MIVPSMTFDEIVKEVIEDHEILQRKMNYVQKHLKKKLGKAILNKGYTFFDDYRSKNKNNWVYRLYITKSKTMGVSMLIYHNGKGHAGIILAPNMNIIIHTGHFFERFNERCKLGLKSLKEIIHAYLNDNHYFEYFSVEEIAPGIKSIFGNTQSGVFMGTINQNIGFIKFNTFLTYDMLSSNQIELKNRVKSEVEKYKATAGEIN